MPKKARSKSQNLLEFAKKHIGLILISLCFFGFLFVRLYNDRAPTGDEPHYLLMTQSIANDHDLNLRNNFENHDYLEYYPNIINPKGQVKDDQLASNASHWYSIHSVGIPVIILPAWIIAGRTGVIVFMVFLATLLIALTYYWVLLVVKNRKLALVSSGTLAVSYFYANLVGYIYPDIIIPLLTIASILILMTKAYDKKWQFLFGLILSFMLLIHFKSLVMVGPLALALVIKNYTKKRKLPWFSLLGFIPLTFYFFFSTHSWFNTWNPVEIYESLNFVGSINPLGIMSALLFDARRGLLVFNPIFLLCLVGLPLWRVKSRETLVITLGVTVPYLLILITFWGWFGGDAPAGRYMMDVMPIFAPSLAFGILALKDLYSKYIAGFLLLVTILITLIQTSLKAGYVSYVENDTAELFIWINKHFSLNFSKLLPNFNLNGGLVGARDIYKVILAYLILLSFFGLGVYSVIRRKKDTI